MVERLAARSCRFKRNGELLLRLRLTDELCQPRGPQLQLEDGVVIDLASGDKPLRICARPGEGNLLRGTLRTVRRISHWGDGKAK